MGCFRNESLIWFNGMHFLEFQNALLTELNRLGSFPKIYLYLK